MKGTSGHGRKSGNRNTIRCRRCGKDSYHASKKKCSSCGYGSSPRMRGYAWQIK